MVTLETAWDDERPGRGMTSASPNAGANGTVSVTRQDAAGTWLIALGGEHDLTTTALLAEETIGVWPHAALVVVDLSGAAFMDSTVVHWLISARRELEASGTGALGIVEGPAGSFAARLFDLLRLPDALVCYQTRRDALAQGSAQGMTTA